MQTRFAYKHYYYINSLIRWGKDWIRNILAILVLDYSPAWLQRCVRVCVQELQKLLSEERIGKEQLSEEIHVLKSRALSEESARGSRSAQEVPYWYLNW